MIIPFEPTKSFCYRFARYQLLDLLAKEPEALSGEPFRLIDLVNRVCQSILTREQLETRIPAAEADRVDTIFASIKFWARYEARHLSNSPFRWLGGGGMFQLKQDSDLEKEMEDAELAAEDDDIVDDGDEDVSNRDGWIYAFTFPALIKDGQPFPIKIGKASREVEGRVSQQCKGSALFDNPVILRKWNVNRMSSFERAIHLTLETRGKWREGVPGKEWFDTTLEEVESIVQFIKQ